MARNRKHDKKEISTHGEAVAPAPLPVPRDSARENTFDFEACRKEVVSDPKASEAIEFFLKYRHREWEENIASGPDRPNERK